MIRDNVALAEAPSQRQDIFSYNAGSPGAEDYLNLCREILDRLENSPIKTEMPRQQRV